VCNFKYLFITNAFLVSGMMGWLCPAHAEPGADILGIYFDWDYSLVCRTAGSGAWVGTVLVLSRASATPILGWECSVNITGALHVQHFLTEGATDTGTGEDNFIVQLGAPLGGLRPVILLGLNVLVGDATVKYYVGPSEPSVLGVPAYRTVDGETVACQPATGSFTEALAVINGDCPTSTAQTTWGVVKQLYR